MAVEPSLDGGAAALARADARTRAALDDLFLADDVRLADRVRLAAFAMLRACVDVAEEAVRRGAARLLAEAGQGAMADAMSHPAGEAFRTLRNAGLLRDAALVEELVAEAGRDWLEERLLPEADAGRHGLLIRLADDADPAIGATAVAFAEAQLHARSMLPLVHLPSPLRRRLTWLVAAAIRREAADPADRALTEAAESLFDDQPASVAALRLAGTIDRRAERRGALLADALRDRSTTLFIAILARASGLDYGTARMLLVEPAETMLWVALRSAGLDRAEAAGIGAMLADADPRRDLAGLAEALDKVWTLSDEMVEQLLAPLRLHPDLRTAARALEAAR